MHKIHRVPVLVAMVLSANGIPFVRLMGFPHQLVFLKEDDTWV